MPVGVFVGLCTLDVVQQVDRLPGTDEKVTAHRQVVAAGGPATNAAVTFAALGGRATLVTALGGGAAADVARADLAACGVSVVDAAPGRNGALPVASVLVRAGTGERAVVSTDAVGLALDLPAGVAAAVDAAVGSADVVLVDGHHGILAVRAAASASAPLVLDAGRWRPSMQAVLPRAAAVICSSAFRMPGTSDVESSARAVVAAGVSLVAVTRGADPVLWWGGDRSGSVRPPRVEVVDTSGAGDALHGAYCYYSAAEPGLPFAELLSRAVRVGSRKCGYFGTRDWLARLD